MNTNLRTYAKRFRAFWWWGYSEEIKIAVAIIGPAAVSFGLFYLLLDGQSATKASKITCSVLLLLFGIAFIRLNYDGLVDDFCRLTMLGSALAISPHSMVFAWPQLISWHSPISAILWLILGFLALASGVFMVRACVHDDDCNSQWACLLVLLSFVTSCGLLGKLAYGDWTWLWATTLLANGGILAQQGYHNGRHGKYNLLVVALSCLAWIEIRYVLWNPNLSFNWLINPLLCLSIFCLSAALGIAFRPRVKPQPAT